MTAAVTRAFPGPRTYQNWLRELSPLRPRRLWFSHLLVHRVEALVAISRSDRLESFARALLRRLFGSNTAAAGLASLDRFCLDRQLAVPVLNKLVAIGLVYADQASWNLTAAGRQALESGSYLQRTEERRVFYFLDNPNGGPPQFVPLTQTAGPAAEIGENWSFDLAHLRLCTEQAADWKQRVGFAEDIEGVLVNSAERWRPVIFDRAEHAPLLFVETAERETVASLTGYGVRCDNWTLQREKPALVLPTEWQGVFPEFAESAAPELWREAWVTWSQAHQLPSAEVTACTVEHVDCKVQIKAPRAFVEQLRTARHEVLRGDTWLTPGSGRTRAAALLELREQE